MAPTPIQANVYQSQQVAHFTTRAPATLNIKMTMSPTHVYLSHSFVEAIEQTRDGNQASELFAFTLNLLQQCLYIVNSIVP